MVKLHQVCHACAGFAMTRDIVCAECRGKIQPDFIMSAMVVTALFIGQVGQHCLAQIAILETHRQFGEIGGKRMHMMIVITGVFPDLLPCQLAFAPGLVEGVGQ